MCASSGGTGSPSLGSSVVGSVYWLVWLVGRLVGYPTSIDSYDTHPDPHTTRHEPYPKKVQGASWMGKRSLRRSARGMARKPKRTDQAQRSTGRGDVLTNLPPNSTITSCRWGGGYGGCVSRLVGWCCGGMVGRTHIQIQNTACVRAWLRTWSATVMKTMAKKMGLCVSPRKTLGLLNSSRALNLLNWIGLDVASVEEVEYVPVLPLPSESDRPADLLVEELAHDEGRKDEGEVRVVVSLAA